MLNPLTGQYTDPTSGLDYYVSRYYDPVAGIFLSADTKEGNAQGSGSLLPCDGHVLKRMWREDGASMAGIEVVNLQAAQRLQRLAQLAAVRGAADQGRTAFHCDQRIAAEQFEGEGVVEAEAFRRVAGAGDDAPVRVIGQTGHVLQPYIHHFYLRGIVGREEIKMMKYPWEHLSRQMGDARDAPVAQVLLLGLGQLPRYCRSRHGSAALTAQVGHAVSVIGMQVCQHDEINIV